MLPACHATLAPVLFCLPHPMQAHASTHTHTHLEVQHGHTGGAHVHGVATVAEQQHLRPASKQQGTVDLPFCCMSDAQAPATQHAGEVVGTCGAIDTKQSITPTWSKSMKEEKRGWWMTAMMDMPRAAMSDSDLQVVMMMRWCGWCVGYASMRACSYTPSLCIFMSLWGTCVPSLT